MDAVLAAMRSHAEAEFPRESCGLLLEGAAGAEYQACPNAAASPETAFRIDPRALAAAGERLLAVVHSHPPPAPPCPSAADMRQQIAMALPWHIVPVGEGGDAAEPFAFGDQARATDRPYVGRGYRHGVDDCYSIVRDWYARERGLVLADQPREWAWWADDGHPDLYERGFAAAGFVEVSPAEAAVGDALLIAFGARAAVSHAGVIVEPGVMLHHPSGAGPHDPNRLSRRDPIARWQGHVRRVLRHPLAAAGGRPA